MGLLDDARRLAGTDPWYQTYDHADGDPMDRCHFCDEEDWSPVEHAPDCPWLAMPRIVAALEAAEAVRLELVRVQESTPGGHPPAYRLYPETVRDLIEALDA